jgi:GDP-mannose transporter
MILCITVQLYFPFFAAFGTDNLVSMLLLRHTLKIYSDWHYFHTPVECLVKVAFAIMLGGACFAAVEDVQITVAGMFWMMVNVLTTAGYVLYMKFATNTVKLTKFGMVFYNNLLCIAFLLPVALMRGEFETFQLAPELHTRMFLLWNVLAGYVGFFLNISSLNCVSVTGPTTYAILGSINKIPVSVFGYLLFRATITHQTWFFMSVSMTGGFLYSYAKLKSNRSSSKDGGGKNEAMNVATNSSTESPTKAG